MTGEIGISVGVVDPGMLRLFGLAKPLFRPGLRARIGRLAGLGDYWVDSGPDEAQIKTRVEQLVALMLEHFPNFYETNKDQIDAKGEKTGA